MNTLTQVSGVPLPRSSAIGRVRLLLQRLVRRSFLWGLISALVLGSAYMYFTRSTTQTQTTATSYATVAKRSIVTSIKATGTVTFASEQELKFNQKGTVTSVNFKVGDRVRQGQVIAALDASSLYSDIRQGELAVGASQLQLQQLQSQQDQTLTDAQNTVDDAQRSLSQAQLDLQKQRDTELQSLASTAQNVLTQADSLLDSFYSILTNNASVRPSQGNYTLDIYQLLYNDTTLASDVQTAYFNTLNLVNGMHTTYGATLSAERDPTKLVQALKDADAVAHSLSNLAEKTATLLQGATTDTGHFSVTALSNARSSVDANRTKASDLVNTIESAQVNLAAVSTNNDLPSITLKQKQDALQQATESLQSKKAAASTTATNTNLNIQLKQNDVAQKQASLNKTRQSLQDYQLTAPFEGVITHIDYKVGDNLLDTGDTEFVTLQNPDFIVVTLPLDQVDVVHVKVGMTATITFDAVPNQTFQGTIDQIDSTPITTSGVVSYDVSVRMATPKDLTLLSGMTSTVVIETLRKDNVLAVPNLALRSVNGESTVQKSDGTTVTVKTGATDGKYTEITSGVTEGDEVLSVNLASTAATSSTSSKSGNSFQILRGLSGGGGGGPPSGGGGPPN